MFVIKAARVVFCVILFSGQVVQSAPKEKEFKRTAGGDMQPKPEQKWKSSMKKEIHYLQSRRHKFGRSAKTCTEEFKAIPGHTMCMTDPSAATEIGLKRGAARFIVQLHNKYRGIVEPPATDMQKMKWDWKLAAVAQKWANQCKLEHDKFRDLPEFVQHVGQNVASGYDTWRDVIKVWYDEIKDWRYGKDPATYVPEKVQIGHFTQMVSNATTLIGCGYAKCTGTKYKSSFVCNYLVGQYKETLIYPYTKGARCAACPNNCVNGICDCGGKFCKNRGKIDLETCECKCEAPFTGDTCDDVSCPPYDRPHCKEWGPSKCSVYTNAPNECPYMCKLCHAKDKKVYEDSEPGTGMTVNGFDFFKSNYGCMFYGRRPSKDTCKRFGYQGQDMLWSCATQKGDFTCDDCLKFTNVGWEFCPVMCGLCDGPVPYQEYQLKKRPTLV